MTSRYQERRVGTRALQAGATSVVEKCTSSVPLSTKSVHMYTFSVHYFTVCPSTLLMSLGVHLHTKSTLLDWLSWERMASAFHLFKRKC